VTVEFTDLRNGNTTVISYPMTAAYKPANRLPLGDYDERFIVVAPVLR
jgi:hypothetical protein